MNTNLWILIAIAAAVLIAGIVVLSRKSRKSSVPGKAAGIDQKKKDESGNERVNGSQQNPPKNIQTADPVNDQYLIPKTRGNTSPQGRPRIYFCCAKEDFDTYFESVTQEMLDYQKNACVWYRDPKLPFPRDEQFLDDLSLMQLFVIPITSHFLHGDDPARTVEMAYAMEKHIPILPLMKEPDLKNEFNTRYHLQYLDKASEINDQTVLPYAEKVRKFLEANLVGDKLAARVRNAFSSYIFLSYRKKDRATAQSVMRMIHENDFCRDVAIWYDEFLTPGENYRNEIAEAMKKSRLVALVVTPLFVATPNYIWEKEYPDAIKMKKDMLPIEAVKTDKKKLLAEYEHIADYDPTGDPKKIAARLKKMNLDSKAGNDPEHNYLVGLAYLNGIDMEKNPDRAVQLISGAAEKGLPEAYEKLVNMYFYGNGVEQSDDETYKWQKAYVEELKKRAEKEDSIEAYEKLCAEHCRLGNFLAYNKEYISAEKNYDRMYDAANKLVQKKAKSADSWLSLSYEKIGLIKLERAKWNSSVTQAKLREVRILLEESLKLNESIARKSPTQTARLDLARAYENLGDLCMEEIKLAEDQNAKNEKLSEAQTLFEKELEIKLSVTKETGTPEDRRKLLFAYERLGQVYHSLGNNEKAEECFKKYLDISKALCDETDTVQSFVDHAVGYELMLLVSDNLDKQMYLKGIAGIYHQLETRTHDAKYGLKALAYEKMMGNLRMNDAKSMAESILSQYR